MFHGWQLHQSYNTIALSTLAGQPGESERCHCRKPYFFLGAPPQTPLCRYIPYDPLSSVTGGSLPLDPGSKKFSKSSPKSSKPLRSQTLSRNSTETKIEHLLSRFEKHESLFAPTRETDCFEDCRLTKGTDRHRTCKCSHEGRIEDRLWCWRYSRYAHLETFLSWFLKREK